MSKIDDTDDSPPFDPDGPLKPPSEELMDDMAEQERKAACYAVMNSDGLISTTVVGKLRKAVEKDIRKRAAEDNALSEDPENIHLLHRGFKSVWLRDIVRAEMRRRGHDV